MEYKIYCKNAKSLINTIFGCFKKKDEDRKRVKIDPQGVAIDTWAFKNTDEGEEVLIHTTQQWDKKGCISLTESEDNDYVQVSFYYWSSFKKEKWNGDEDKYYLGRFTELILVHFYPQIDSVEIV